MINEVAVVILVGILGWELTLMYVAAGLTVAYVGGIIMERFKPERWVEDYVWKIHMGQVALPEPDTSLAGRHRYACHEVKEIVGRLWKWVIAGIALGALFHGYVPEGWVTEHLGGKDNWLAVPGAVLLGIPLYSNATGVIPVAEAMLGKGVAVGTTLACMMSIAALSLPELIILRKVIKWPGLAAFSAVLAVAFIVVGWGFNLLTWGIFHERTTAITFLHRRHGLAGRRHRPQSPGHGPVSAAAPARHRHPRAPDRRGDRDRAPHP